MKFISFLLKLTGFLTIFCAFVGFLTLMLAGYWLQAEDKLEPGQVADAIVVLGGSYFRPLYAADLYIEGRAPVVYVGRVIPPKEAKILKEVDVDLPLQEEAYRRILVRKGVPQEAVRLYGHRLISTAQEAQALKGIFKGEPRTLILVTSPFHVRRAKLIFEDILPECEILAVGSPYEPFPKKWWTTQQSALKVVSETSKFLFYLAGGRFETFEAAPDCGPVFGDNATAQPTVQPGTPSPAPLQ
ncbi:MAG: YdcF family protein [Thermodesulfobacteriota bacterium]|nr:YdcF family protein [Thermodesulfobacteriota bacterium]